MYMNGSVDPGDRSGWDFSVRINSKLIVEDSGVCGGTIPNIGPPSNVGHFFFFSLRYEMKP